MKLGKSSRSNSPINYLNVSCLGSVSQRYLRSNSPVAKIPPRPEGSQVPLQDLSFQISLWICPLASIKLPVEWHKTFPALQRLSILASYTNPHLSKREEKKKGELRSVAGKQASLQYNTNLLDHQANISLEVCHIFCFLMDWTLTAVEILILPRLSWHENCTLITDEGCWLHLFQGRSTLSANKLNCLRPVPCFLWLSYLFSHFLMRQHTNICLVWSLAAAHLLSSLCHQLDQLDSRPGGTDTVVVSFEHD